MWCWSHVSLKHCLYSLSLSVCVRVSVCVLSIPVSTVHSQYVLRLASYISGNHYPSRWTTFTCRMSTIFIIIEAILRYSIWIYQRWVCVCVCANICISIYMANLWNDVRFSEALSHFYLFVWLLFYEMYDFSFVDNSNSTQLNSTHAYPYEELYTCKNARTHINVFPPVTHQHQLLFMS